MGSLLIVGVRFGAGSQHEAVVLTGLAPSGAAPDLSGPTFDVPVTLGTDLTCTAVPYRTITIHLDPGAPQPVWASTDTLPRLPSSGWSPIAGSSARRR